TALDYMYEQGADFDEVYARLAEMVLEAGRRGDVTYAVPGHPLLGERSVELLVRSARAEGQSFRVAPASSFVDAALAALAVHAPGAGSGHLQLLDATDLSAGRLVSSLPSLIYQVFDADTASRLKIALLEE